MLESQNHYATLQSVLFAGIDLGWTSQPSGLARIEPRGQAPARVVRLERVATHRDVLAWVDHEAGSGPAMLAIDAPLVIPNATGIRECERQVNSVFRSFHAGCHACNQGRPFALPMRSFVQELEDRGFMHAVGIEPGTPGRYMIEVHPHAATVRLFGLNRIVKYKKGRLAERSRQLARYRQLLASIAGPLPEIAPGAKAHKEVEDQLDAINAAFTGWLCYSGKTECFGDREQGYIVIPRGPLE